MSNTYLAASAAFLAATTSGPPLALHSADLKTTSRVRKNTVGKKEKVRHVEHLLGCVIPRVVCTPRFGIPRVVCTPRFGILSSMLRVVCPPLGRPENNIESEKEHGWQKRKKFDMSDTYLAASFSRAVFSVCLMYSDASGVVSHCT